MIARSGIFLIAVTLSFSAAGRVTAQSAPAADRRGSVIESQPEDPFVDLLRYRLGHRDIYAYRTTTDGDDRVEAMTATHRGIEEILDLYASEFDRAKLRYRVEHRPEEPFASFHGTIEGEEKTLVLISLPGGITLVRITSERTDYEHRRSRESLLDTHPELRRLGHAIAIQREHDQGIGRTGLLLYHSSDAPAVAIDRARSALRAEGWSEVVAGGDGGTRMVHFRKGDAVASLVSASDAGDPRSAFALHVRHVPSR